MRVCKSYDEYIQDKDHPIWVLTLSNGESIYQDDGRYQITEKDETTGESVVVFSDDAFTRAKEYIESEQLSVTNIAIRFRSHCVQVHQNIDNHIMFTKVIGAHAFVEQEKMYVQESNLYYTFGVYNGDKLVCKRYKVPEIELFLEEAIETDKFEERNYIWNPNQPKITKLKEKQKRSD